MLFRPLSRRNLSPSVVSRTCHIIGACSMHAIQATGHGPGLAQMVTTPGEGRPTQQPFVFSGYQIYLVNDGKFCRGG